MRSAVGIHPRFGGGARLDRGALWVAIVFSPCVGGYLVLGGSGRPELFCYGANELAFVFLNGARWKGCGTGTNYDAAER